jgi:hypothetical protein
MLNSIKEIKVMPEFESAGIWDFETDVMLDPVEIGMPQDIIDSMDDWINLYEECFVDDGTYDNMIPEKCVELNKDGLALAKRIKEHFPKLVVVYMGEDNIGVHELKIIA